MKKIMFAGIVIFLVMFAVTCDSFQPYDPTDDDAILYYTDVEYVDMDEGSQITVYLDGTKPVPVTKKSQRAMAERAMTKNLAKMAYDYLEVIFVSNGTVARAYWELGQSAGISGVNRNDGENDYAWVSGDVDGVALIFVGKKSDKTLLGVGQILQVDRLPKVVTPYTWNAQGLPNTVGGDPYDAVIVEKTQSVTFWVEAVKTGLLIKTESTAGSTDIEQKVSFDSFTSTTTASIRLNATRSALGNQYYPMYPLPVPKRDTVFPNDWLTYTANYEFGGAAKTFDKEIILETDGVVAVEKRFPRYMDGGRYREPQNKVDIDTEVEIVGTISAYTNIIPLLFRPLGYGIFSFYIEIPVYMLTDDKGTNGGELEPIHWKIRTGLGSELYSMDDGLSNGGCVLIGIGVSALDWLEIEWDWAK
jgi:hypothetical protein